LVYNNIATRYSRNKLTNMTTMITRFLTLLVFALFAFACGDTTTTADEKAGEMTAEAVEAVDVTLSPMPATTAFPNATLQEWTYNNGTFNYVVADYEFAEQTPDAESVMCANSGKGQHAHLIVNNDPYMAKYEPTFDVDLPDGSHYIMTFLSRSYHESIKNGKAFRAVKAEVKDKSFANVTDIEEPMLFYSRPKGTYVGKKATENVMLDFFPVNAKLGSEYQVKAVVNGKNEFMINEWRPYYLTNLPMGENTVELTLMKDGVAVDAPLNPVTRTFKLEADPAGE
jgi:hypothetical protein